MTSRTSELLDLLKSLCICLGYMVAVTTHKDLESVLLDPKTPGVKEPYFAIEGENGENILVISAGKNGPEFNKTLGYFHTFPGVEIYHCLYGQGVILIQRNDGGNEAKEIRVLALRPGAIVEVPSGYGHTVVNTGKNFLVVANNAPQNNKLHDSELVKDKKGFAYYIVDKKGNISFEPNPNYSFHPQVSMY